MKKLTLPQLLLASSVMFGLAACGGGGGGGGDDPAPTDPTPTDPAPTDPAPTDPTPTDPAPTAGDTFAVTASNQLVSFNRAEPGTIVTTTAIGGLASGDNIVDIDFRPSNGQLYALGRSGTIYTIDTNTAAASAVSVSSVALDAAATDFGIDFDPSLDRLRVVSNTGQTLRINVDNGAAIARAQNVSGITLGDLAYSNSFAGSDASATIYAIDTGTDAVGQFDITAGTLNTSKPLGADSGAIGGFDIDGRNNVGYAAVSANGATTLISINPARLDPSNNNPHTATVGTIGVNEEIRGLAIPTPASPTVVGLANDNRLVTFSALAPATLTTDVTVSGLQAAGERLVGIDVRPADGQVYGISTTGAIYTIDPATGAATFKSTSSVALTGEQFGVDFNPQADALRVVSNTGQSLRINVDSGSATADGNVPAGTAIVASAYSNNFAGATITSLYGINTTDDSVYRQDPATGAVTLVGPTGVAVGTDAGFDIAGGANGLSLAAIGNGTSTTLYRLSFRSGAATPFVAGDATQSLIGGGNVSVNDIAIILR